MFLDLTRNLVFERDFISIKYGSTKTISIDIKGLMPHMLVSDDENLINSLQIFRSTLEKIFELYSEKYVFHKPQLRIIPDEKIMTIEIYMLEREIYEQSCRN